MVAKVMRLLLFMSSSMLMGMHSELARWVQKADMITISMIKMQYNVEIPITDATTVRDIKNELYKTEGIPIEKQVIKPLNPYACMCCKIMGSTLDDGNNIKMIMHRHNTDHFGVYLQLLK